MIKDVKITTQRDESFQALLMGCEGHKVGAYSLAGSTHVCSWAPETYLHRDEGRDNKCSRLGDSLDRIAHDIV
jgi:hypothetical protein